MLCHDATEDVAEMTEVALATALRHRFAEWVQTSVIAAGMPFGIDRSTNVVRIVQVS
jgi:pyruvate kinase